MISVISSKKEESTDTAPKIGHKKWLTDTIPKVDDISPMPLLEGNEDVKKRKSLLQTNY